MGNIAPTHTLMGIIAMEAAVTEGIKAAGVYSRIALTRSDTILRDHHWPSEANSELTMVLLFKVAQHAA